MTEFQHWNKIRGDITTNNSVTVLYKERSMASDHGNVLPVREESGPFIPAGQRELRNVSEDRAEGEGKTL